MRKNDDTISRQAAIDTLFELYEYQRDIDPTEAADLVRQGIYLAEKKIEQLPSAQPEIIRCKDCRWWDKSEDSPFGYCMAMKHGYMSTNWEIGIYRKYKGDFYCADAERREE